jgi:hypothetical protein
MSGASLSAPLMRPRRDLPVVYRCRRPVDCRKGMRALAVLVAQERGRDPFADTRYVFTHRRRTAVKGANAHHSISTGIIGGSSSRGIGKLANNTMK